MTVREVVRKILNAVPDECVPAAWFALLVELNGYEVLHLKLSDISMRKGFESCRGALLGPEALDVLLKQQRVGDGLAFPGLPEDFPKMLAEARPAAHGRPARYGQHPTRGLQDVARRMYREQLVDDARASVLAEVEAISGEED